MRQLLPDLRPARQSPAFRNLLLGGTVSMAGSMMTLYAVTLQIWDLTRSNFAVGALGFTFVPTLAFGLLGGSLADVLDRRLSGLVTSAGLAVVSVMFAAQAFAGFGRLWLLYLLAMVQAALQATGMPARRTFIARLLPRELITAGVALDSAGGRVAMLAGPALAGVITAAWGLKACYLIDALSFGGVLYAMFRLPPMPPEPAAPDAAAPDAGGPAARRPSARGMLRSSVEGLDYVRRTPVLLAAFAADLDAVLFGLPTALFPGLNAAHFGGRPQTLGLLTAAVGCGGLISAGLAGLAGRPTRQGRALLVTTALWGAAIAGFALARSLPLALLLLVLAGAADTFTVVFRGAIVQTVTPERFRGRVSSAEFIVGVGGGPLGNVESGTVAALTGSATASAFIGGIACLAGVAVLAVTCPALSRYRLHPVPVPQASPAGLAHRRFARRRRPD